MKLKRFLCLCLALCMAFSLCLPVFATEGEETGSEPSETPVEVTEGEEPTEPSETPTEPSDEPTEGSEGEEVTEPSETPTEPETEVTEPVVTPTPTLDGATVNVSQESIAAIADAVVNKDSIVFTSSNGTQYTLQLGSDNTFYTWEDFITDWSSYDYKVICVSSYACGLYLSNEELEIVGSGAAGYYTMSNTDDGICYRISKVGKDIYLYNSAPVYNNFSSITCKLDSFANGWSNYNLFYNGELVHPSDVERFYIVSFNTGFDDLVFDTQSSYGFTAPVPSYDGYRFDGWYLDEDYTLPYTTDYVFVADTTLYAKWTKYVTVSFVSGIEDYELDSVQVLSGEAYTPPDFAYSGYEYLGAYTDEEYKTPFVGGTVVDKDITLYLRFEPIVYDYGSMMLEISNRLEGLTYVVLAQSIITSVGVLALFFFRRDSMGV